MRKAIFSHPKTKPLLILHVGAGFGTHSIVAAAARPDVADHVVACEKSADLLSVAERAARDNQVPPPPPAPAPAPAPAADIGADVPHIMLTAGSAMVHPDRYQLGQHIALRHARQLGVRQLRAERQKSIRVGSLLLRASAAHALAQQVARGGEEPRARLRRARCPMPRKPLAALAPCFFKPLVRR